MFIKFIIIELKCPDEELWLDIFSFSLFRFPEYWSLITHIIVQDLFDVFQFCKVLNVNLF